MRQIISNKNSFSPSRYLALFMLWKASKQQMESMLRWVGSQRKKSIPLKIFGRHNAWPEFQNWFSFRTFSSSSISSAACTLPFRRGSWVQGGESIELIVSLNHINSRTHTHMRAHAFNHMYLADRFLLISVLHWFQYTVKVVDVLQTDHSPHSCRYVTQSVTKGEKKPYNSNLFIGFISFSVYFRRKKLY